jgi:ribosome maturation factor RimP
MSELRDQQKALFQLMEPTVEHLGYELVAVELTTVLGRRTLRVSVDKPGGMVVTDCTAVSRELNPLLDVEDPLKGAFDLEVSSPGDDRPLQRTSDFLRFAGFTARVRLEKGEGRRNFKGVLGGLSGDDLTIDVDGTEHVLPLSQVERAHLVLTLDEYLALAADPPDRVQLQGENR